ncbi:MAG: N-acetylmuramoyl-L-alanine amidase [Pseudomonadota bacterium]
MHFLQLPGLRDRRIAASDETMSSAGGGNRIYRRGSMARRVGADRARRMDREYNEIRAIVLHSTAGPSFLPGTRSAYPEDAATDADIASRTRLDRVAAHFVVTNDGAIFYTHDLGYWIASAGGRRGIDIEFAGRFANSEDPPAGATERLSPAAITSGRALVQSLSRSLSTITHIHPHGQVQRNDREGRCGSGTENTCSKLYSCPGPDIWVNVGAWAVEHLGLVCDTTLEGYQNNGIHPRQSNAAYARGQP